MVGHCFYEKFIFKICEDGRSTRTLAEKRFKHRTITEEEYQNGMQDVVSF